MPIRRKIILYLGLVLGLIGIITTIWAIDTGRLGTSASEETITSAKDLKKLPSPDESTFSKIFSAILSPLIR